MVISRPNYIVSTRPGPSTGETLYVDSYGRVWTDDPAKVASQSNVTAVRNGVISGGDRIKERG